MKIPFIFFLFLSFCQWTVGQTLDLQLKKIPSGIKCPFKSYCFSKQLPTKKSIFFGADLLLGKNSESPNFSMQNLVKTYHITTPLYAGFQLGEDYFIEGGPYFSILVNRLVDNPFEYTSTRPDEMEFGVDGGFSTAFGCKISDRGSLKLRYNLGISSFHSNLKFLEHPNTRRIEIGLNLKL